MIRTGRRLGDRELSHLGDLVDACFIRFRVRLPSHCRNVRMGSQVRRRRGDIRSVLGRVLAPMAGCFMGKVVEEAWLTAALDNVS